MANKLLDQRSAEKIKNILKLAKTFIFKDEDKANSFEDELSIIYSSAYIDAIDGTLPFIEKYNDVGFSSVLNEYNLVNDKVNYFISCYRTNTLYIGTDITKLKEVSESTPYTNKANGDSAFRGNVYERNAYYRELYAEYDIDPYDARKTKNYGILHYDEDFIPSDFDIDKFLDIYNSNRDLFVASLDNIALRWDANIKIFNTWLITIMSIFNYMDDELNKAFNADLFDTYDIRNALYSYGITFLNDLPIAYQLRVIKNIRQLIKAKATGSVFDIIIKEIFGIDSVEVYKYYLIRKLNTAEDVQAQFENGEITLKEIREKSDLVFVRVPYDVQDIRRYLNEHPDIETFSYNGIVEQDSRYWKTSEAEVRAIDFDILQTKYIDVNSSITLNEDTEGFMLLFAMLHANRMLFKIDTISTFGVLEMPLFDAFVILLHMQAVLNGADNNVGYTIDGNYLVSTLAYYNELISTAKDTIPLLNIKDKEIELGTHGDRNDISITFRYTNSEYINSLEESFANIEKLSEGMNEEVFANKFIQSMIALRDAKFVCAHIDEIDDELGASIVRFYKMEGDEPVEWLRTSDDINKAIEEGAVVKGLFSRNYVSNIAAIALSASGDKSDVVKGLKETADNLEDSEGIIEEYCGMANVFELVLLRNDINRSFSEKGDPEKGTPIKQYGYYAGNYDMAESSADFIKKKYPKIFNVIENEISISTANLRNKFNSFVGDLVVFFERYKMNEYIDFKSFVKAYLSDYAVKLIEKFASYTVQMRSVGEEVSIKDTWSSRLIAFDRITTTDEIRDDIETDHFNNNDEINGGYIHADHFDMSTRLSDSLYAHMVSHYGDEEPATKFLKYNRFATMAMVNSHSCNSARPFKYVNENGKWVEYTDYGDINTIVPQHRIDAENIEIINTVIYVSENNSDVAYITEDTSKDTLYTAEEI